MYGVVSTTTSPAWKPLPVTVTGSPHPAEDLLTLIVAPAADDGTALGSRPATSKATRARIRMGTKRVRCCIRILLLRATSGLDYSPLFFTGKQSKRLYASVVPKC